MTLKRSAAVLSVICVAALSSCGTATPSDTSYTENSTQPTTAFTEAPDTPETTAADKKEPAFQEIEYAEDIGRTVFADIDITARQIDDPIVFGERYGNWISRRVWSYFGYSAGGIWVFSSVDGFFDEENDKMYNLCVSLRHDNATPSYNEDGTPISYASGRKYITEKLHITEHCFDILCETSPSSYCEKDGKLYFSEGFGGGAGWDHSVIVDYETGEDAVTYNCMRLGWEQGGYEDTPFTVTFRYVDGRWLLDDCTYVEGFCNYFCETEPVDDYYSYFNS